MLRWALCSFGVFLIGFLVFSLMREIFQTRNVIIVTDGNAGTSRLLFRKAITTGQGTFDNDLDVSFPDSRPPQCTQYEFKPLTTPYVTVIIRAVDRDALPLTRFLQSLGDHSIDSSRMEILVFSAFEINLDINKGYRFRINWIQIGRNTPGMSVLFRAAGIAKGDIVIFMNSLTLVNNGWLLPLVSILEKEPRCIAQPFPDHATLNAGNYTNSEVIVKGLFDWYLNTKYIALSKEQHLNYSGANSYESPILLNNVFATSKLFLLEILSLYESENLTIHSLMELSLYAWSCGNGIKVSLCSRIRHLAHGNKEPNSEQMTLDMKVQIADLWLDYHKIYFDSVFKNKLLSQNDKKFLNFHREKKSRECKPFDWFRRRLMPHLTPPPHDALVFGRVRNTQHQLCVGYNQTKSKYLILVNCESPETSFVAITKKGVVKIGDKCVTSYRTYLYTGGCGQHNYGEWAFSSDGTIRWWDNRCITITGIKGKPELRVQACLKRLRDFATWTFDYNIYWNKTIA